MKSVKPGLNRLLWGMFLILLAFGVGVAYYFAHYSLLLRLTGGLLLTVILAGIASQTKEGRKLLGGWQLVVQEVRKVYWPTRKETVQTTLAVLAMVVVMGMLLWTADFILLRAVAFLTGRLGV